ncbi:hypothetical protein MXM31_07845 [Klebsiella aerogenes]|uniref:hypothetical protein n=1 Tax=Klebsiella aerogenes TaxID=548 RepID=UPI002DB5668E|nr:hypothetical protein [Klebsiella aerogenes]MEB5696085.1 hypothetical protein [Klebsiella aerogenes]
MVITTCCQSRLCFDQLTQINNTPYKKSPKNDFCQRDKQNKKNIINNALAPPSKKTKMTYDEIKTIYRLKIKNKIQQIKPPKTQKQTIKNCKVIVFIEKCYELSKKNKTYRHKKADKIHTQTTRLM